jgi:hypothetical protein
MPLVVRLTPDIEEGLRRLSLEEHKSQAEVVRSLIAERLREPRVRQSAYAIAQELGIIGSDNDRRTDTAAKHASYVRAALMKKSKRTASAAPARKRRS